MSGLGPECAKTHRSRGSAAALVRRAVSIKVDLLVNCQTSSHPHAVTSFSADSNHMGVERWHGSSCTIVCRFTWFRLSALNGRKTTLSTIIFK